jgi:hypothetical protein
MAEVIDIMKARLDRAELVYTIRITHTHAAMGMEITGIDLDQDGGIDLLVGDLGAAIDALTGKGYTEIAPPDGDTDPAG